MEKHEKRCEVVLSIVIATHNRANYAVHCIRSILSINSQALELVIHDTSTDNILSASISQFVDDPRFHYRHCSERLSMTENHNRALSLATGEYLCLIGDDDTVSPEIVDAVDWALRNDVDAVAPIVVANYAWPDFRSKVFGAGHSSRLYINEFSSDVTRLSSSVGLEKALKNACQGTDDLPRIYHGIVRRSVMERVKSKTGNYFFGVSPDVSGALAIALMVDSFLQVDYPLTIPGAAGNSNTGRSAMNTHRGKLEDDPHIKPYKNLVWPELIPRFFSVETVWGQAAYETLSKLDVRHLKRFNFIRLYSICLINHPSYYKVVFEALKAYVSSSHRSAISAYSTLFLNITSLIGAKFIRQMRRAMRPTAAGGRFFVPETENILDAGKALVGVLQKRKVSFKNAVNQEI